MADWSEQKKTLEDRRADLAGDLAGIADALDDPMPKDWEEAASERQDDEVLNALGEHDRAEIRRIDAALARIADGTYGECVKCGEPISEARLKALPDTPFCKNCA